MSSNHAESGWKRRWRTEAEQANSYEVEWTEAEVAEEVELMEAELAEEVEGAEALLAEEVERTVAELAEEVEQSEEAELTNQCQRKIPYDPNLILFILEKGGRHMTRL